MFLVVPGNSGGAGDSVVDAVAPVHAVDGGGEHSWIASPTAKAKRYKISSKSQGFCANNMFA